MKKFYAWLTSILVISSFNVNAQQFFSEISEFKLVGTGTRVTIPQKYRTVSLNNTALENFLLGLPVEKSVDRNSAPVLELPTPNGGVSRFRVWESSIMEEGLAQKYPEIRTFAGQGIDDPAANIRFSYDPYWGLAAQVLSPSGAFYISPYARENINNYIVYYGNDHDKAGGFVCDTDADLPTNQRVLAGPCRGTELFSYRIAVACTGEYAIAATGLSSPTKAQVLAKIVITVNRVNSVYENDLAIRLILVATNDLVVYTNPNTDQFNGNDNSNTLIAESQSVIGTVIGSSNYDIGHTFSTGAGGLAGLGVVCNTSNKARGVTGLPNPTGDEYDIDFVAHEIGHQFGGSHTFNSTTSGCAGNRSSNQAYEVGSGTTIQAYAGLCGSDNLQNNSDPYFHAISFDQISNFVSTGGGAVCKVATPTGNTLPVINSMDNNNMNIPLSTPFILNASASDANGDAITYSWEEWDLGPSTAWNQGNGNLASPNLSSPLFKSRVPTTSGSRSFPSLAYLLAGSPINPSASMGGLKGETMPTFARTMKFRVTVRDNRAGGGGVVSGGDGCQISTLFQVNTIAATGPFRVLVPNGFESYPGGSSQNITWDVAGTSAAPISTANVKITMSTDGGQTYPITLAASTANDGAEMLTIPVGATTTARVKIEAVGNIYYDISNNNFSVTGAANPTFTFNSAAPATITCGSTATFSTTLGSTVVNGFSTPITLAATSGVPAGTTVSFSVNPLVPGNNVTVTLNNANTLSAGTYTITITGTAGAEVKTQDLSFVVQAGAGPTFTTQPSAQTVCSGNPVTFSSIATSATSYQWQVSVAGGAFTDIAGATSASYTIPSAASSLSGNIYHVVASWQCGNTTSNNALLTVTGSPAITTQPSAPSACTNGNTTVTVAATGSALGYQWQLSTNGGGTFSNISGANTSTLQLNNVTAGMNNNQYQVVITNTCGTVTSTPVTLTVSNSVSVTSQPTPQSVCAGAAASFDATAVGSGLTYQWQVSTNGGGTFTDVAGATTSTYSIAATTAAQNGNIYRMVATGQCGTATSNNAALTVTTPASITTQPVATSACTGSNATISAVAAGTGITYQWQVSTNGGTTFTNVSGATTASLQLNAVTASMNNNQYQVIVTNTCATVTSNPVVLTVNNTAAINTQPVASTVCAGSSATFSVAAVGAGLAYQWQVSTDNGGTWTNVAGATSATLNLTNTTTSLDGNRYRVLITSTCSPAGTTSNAAELTVNANLVVSSLLPAQTYGCVNQALDLSVSATGSGVTFQWQGSTDNGATWQNLTGADATTDSYSFASLQLSQDDTRYRVLISGIPCGRDTSETILFVSDNLSVSLTSSAATVAPPNSVTLTATVNNGNPAADYSYLWSFNNQVTDNNTLQVNADGIGEQWVQVTDVASGCAGRDTVTIGGAVTDRVFVYPNPSTGFFQVRYYNPNASVKSINIYDSKGARVYRREFQLTGLYQPMNIDISNYSNGVYMLELLDSNGKRIAVTQLLKK